MEENKNLNKENESTTAKTAEMSKEKKVAKKTAAKKTTAKNRVKAAEQKENKAKADFRKLKEEMKERKAAKKRANEIKAAEKEKIKAEKRVELARIKADRKAAKAKAKADKEREIKRRKIAAKSRKEELKHKKAERKELLKHETKSQKEKRKRAEKADKMRIKKAKIDAKRAKHAEKVKNKQALQEMKAQRRYEKQQSKTKGVGGWLAAVISLGVIVLALGTLVTLNYLIPSETGVRLTSDYEKSYYEFTESINNLDLNLSKLVVSEGKEEEQRLFMDIIVESELAENDLSRIPVDDEYKFKISKFVNQIGDYTKYLNKKLIGGGTLSDEERETISKIQKVAEELKKKLAMAGEQMSEGDFKQLLNDKGNLLSKNFNEMQNLSVDYPELIYDGAFSDAKKKGELLIDGKEITKAQAEDVFAKVFADAGKIKIEETERVKGKYDVYYINGKDDKNRTMFAEISVKGGKIVMFSYDEACSETKYGEDETIETAKKFLEKIKIEDMVPVWKQVSGNSVTYNFATVQSGVIIYNDLIKVKVCLGTNKVTGMEACSYYTNHKQRTIEKAMVEKDEAAGMVSSKIDVYSTRLTLIPVGSKETLAYEFVGDYNGSTYYVYISALSGEELNIFKVIDTKDGKLIY